VKYRILEARGARDSDAVRCIDHWLASPVTGTDGTPSAVVTVRTIEPARENSGETGVDTDPANDAWFWGIRQTADVAFPDCPRPVVFPWNGKVDDASDYPLQDAALGASGPEPTSRGDVLEHTASDVATGAAESIKIGSAELTNLVIALVLVAIVLYFLKEK